MKLGKKLCDYLEKHMPGKEKRVAKALRQEWVSILEQ